MISILKRDLGIRRAHRKAQRGDTKGALDELNQLLEKYGRHPDLVVQKAWLLGEMREFSTALAWTDEAISEKPSAVLWMIRGEILFELQRFEEAKESLQKSLSLSGENLRTEYLLGLVYIALQKPDEASRLFEGSIRYDKNLVQSRLLAMAETYLLEKRLRRN